GKLVLAARALLVAAALGRAWHPQRLSGRSVREGNGRAQRGLLPRGADLPFERDLRAAVARGVRQPSLADARLSQPVERRRGEAVARLAGQGADRMAFPRMPDGPARAAKARS